LTVIVYILAFILDLLLGDPQHWPHPIRWIGHTIHFFEMTLRMWFQKAQHLYFAGVLLWFIVVGGTYMVTSVIIFVAFQCHFALGVIVEIWFAYTVLATRCLNDCAMQVYDALDSGNLEESRQQLSYIVGRDTSQLDHHQITRAVVETVAENTVDGVIAPLFYLFIGGVPLAMAYKAINTLDSMVGYKNEKYGEIGYFSAKLDDLANYIPARLSWLLFSIAAKVKNCNAKQAFLIGWRDRHQHKSPNCAWSEGAMAGALGVRLGGSHLYFGQVVEKPWIGDDIRDIHRHDIVMSVQLMYVASIITLVFFCLVLWM